jgi:hypothetical protein
LAETWLTDCIPDKYIFDDYYVFRNDRTGRGGGVLIAAKNCYKCSQKILNSDKEDVCIEIYVKKYKLLFHTLYRPPNTNLDFNDYFTNIFENCELNFYDFICVLGDFNIDFSLQKNRHCKSFRT